MYEILISISMVHTEGIMNKKYSVHTLRYSNFQSAHESDVRSRLIKEPAQAKEKQKTEPK